MQFLPPHYLSQYRDRSDQNPQHLLLNISTIFPPNVFQALSSLSLSNGCLEPILLFLSTGQLLLVLEIVLAFFSLSSCIFPPCCFTTRKLQGLFCCNDAMKSDLEITLTWKIQPHFGAPSPVSRSRHFSLYVAFKISRILTAHNLFFECTAHNITQISKSTLKFHFNQ